MEKIINYFKQLGIDANTTATILITLLTFSLGLFLAWLARQLKSIKEKSSYKKSLLLILSDFSRACNKQNEVVLKSLEKVGLQSNNDFIINYIPIATLDYLYKLDFNIFLQNFEPTFFKKSFSKAMSKLFDLIAHIKIQNDTISDFLKYFSNEYKLYEREYYENISMLRKTHDHFLLTISNNRNELIEYKQYIIQYLEIFKAWIDAGANRDVGSTHKSIVLKVMALNRNNTHVQLTSEINEIAMKCDMAFQNIEKVDNMLMDKFKQFAHFHRRASRVMNTIIKIIK